MGLKVYWTDFSKNALKNIFDYHHEKVNLKIAQQITKKIIGKAESLSGFPKMGAMEELLNDRPQNFRYVINTNYKIIYWINHDKNRI
ncbi:type II toxin-antitoxin system RelE/ParE family toxin [Pedobacter arcticus]|uniref:type II toxin-antitoxin system RelE/ParE family toxin n=1 Tax=Pedobacter arcticus TaxID=752140 RepID=UPI0002F2F7D9|nr:type II toxin-antitoxin system RelE/ParE family toxin [Pedobacter arcticus]